MDGEWATPRGRDISGSILTGNREPQRDMTRPESRLDGRIGGLESQIDALHSKMGELRERMAHSEGLLEGFGEASQGGLQPIEGHAGLAEWRTKSVITRKRFDDTLPF